MESQKRELELLSKMNPVNCSNNSEDSVVKEISPPSLQLSIGLQPAPRTYRNREKLIRLAKSPTQLIHSQQRVRPLATFDLNENRSVGHPSRFRREGVVAGDCSAVDIDIISGVKRKAEETRRETEESLREAETMKQEAREQIRLAEERKERARRQIEQAQFELAIAKQIREQAREEVAKAEAMRQQIKNPNYLCPSCHHPLHADSTTPPRGGDTSASSSAIRAPAWQPDNSQQQNALPRHRDHLSFQLRAETVASFASHTHPTTQPMP